ncbi:hypothetical protein L917_17674 [Phytophthora nicotianae]|uniref:Uncharacterized protein n=1 Tax=Phytophthora nicotianae TaxID=4792 RepID=W2KAH0_PHYNI|nr:hypothetical protein L917_17674 [Phytophthora nicotianae]
MTTVDLTTEDLKRAVFVGKKSGYSVTFLLWLSPFLSTVRRLRIVLGFNCVALEPRISLNVDQNLFVLGLRVNAPAKSE